jgi:uncharacterized lipoprotein YehR (DUF1307 family)
MKITRLAALSLAALMAAFSLAGCGSEKIRIERVQISRVCGQ